MVFTALGVIALVAFIVLAVISNMNSSGGDDASANGPTPSSSATSVPLPEETLIAEPVTPESTPQPTVAAPQPEVAPSANSVPVVAESLTPIPQEGFGVNQAELEANLTPEEIQARETIYKVIPVAANKASSKYTSPIGPRDELVGQGLITDNMATNWFADQFTPFEKDINSSGFTVQTTGYNCIMRTLTPATALQMGKVNCYYTRHYVDAEGSRVSNSEYAEKTGGIGFIDPAQIALVEVYVKQEGGSWKVDDLRFN